MFEVDPNPCVLSGASVRPFLLPVPQINLSGNLVAKRIESILGILPNRSDLLKIANQMGWGPQTREEKRIKAHHLAKLEKMADLILPRLETPAGIHELQAAYASLLDQRRANLPFVEFPLRNLTSVEQELPPETTIQFYLNKH
jgi:hypothetical protein